MRRQGHQIFNDELGRFAAAAADARVTTIAENAAAPLWVAVRGRGGVGCSTVARALDRAGRASGIRAAESDALDAGAADLVVYVTTEVIKPEDLDAISAAVGARHPVVVVLNKADLTGFAGDGPVIAARARCARLAGLAGLDGVPVEPMIGLLAVAALDDLPDAAWAALRGLATDGPLVAQDGQRLLDTLDLFGTALAVAAVRKGWTPARLRLMLRRVSCVDAVVAKVFALGAEVRYRRVLDAVAALEALAVSGDRSGERISDFLARDDTVVARMAAAADLAEANVGQAGGGTDPATHLSRAVRWQRYSWDSRVSDVHRACAADITRGSLRLWSQAAGPEELEQLGELR
jgi:hypothetical protein